ncbi:hypothetical protein MIMGU_mgv11b014695mg [Erythranthe guttata]|uniref:Uncharacterized protein n=1 Tax=Erythranthe guttata TaxID=4155 RepID=A0A022QHJ3_ERYGU|nr:hypothetical protein MIMGU_mgv11b014695mg [Erythranthe guttata]
MVFETRNLLTVFCKGSWRFVEKPPHLFLFPPPFFFCSSPISISPSIPNFEFDSPDPSIDDDRLNPQHI